MSLQYKQHNWYKSLKKLTEEREQRMIKWYHDDLPYPETSKQEIECWRHLDVACIRIGNSSDNSDGLLPQHPMHAEHFSYSSSDNMCM